MADVTGPISTLPGAGHDVPVGATCDKHPRRKATVRIQGETDSFGCELHDFCDECWAKELEYRRSPAGQAEAAEWRTGRCEWCRNDATDLRDARDYEEGMNGRVYRVCGACIKRRDDRDREELDAYDSWDDDLDERISEGR